ncbi:MULTISPECIES: hypothetical protein [unclassified Methylobacterium]|uniref:hypothetical protein n=1 Tax=unclassified Methylobacterium TaxID=2615210 RepID=UPI0016500652|nr:MULTISPECIES: hypothetical protein [unclassified Methylobacterium]
MHLLAVELVIRLEAAHLLDLADAEFDHMVEGLNEAGRERAPNGLKRGLQMRAS